ncbi:MAG: histidine kinase [Bacteroidetes bacterium]|nr:histidine kinase [Bacteroidota bacterium]
MKTIRLFIILIFIFPGIGFLFSPIVFSQDFENFSVDQGLPQSTVFSIIQDDTGFLWFGTADGLARFDGYSFFVFRNDPADSTSLPANPITGLYTGINGDFYSNSFSTFFSYQSSTQTFSKIRIPGNPIQGVTSKKAFYFTNELLNEYDLKSGSVKTLSPFKGSVSQIYGFHSFSSSVSACISFKTLSVFVDGKQSHSFLFPLPFKQAEWIEISGDSETLFLAGKGANNSLLVYSYSLSTKKLELLGDTSFKFQPNEAIIFSGLGVSRDQKIWIAIHNFGLIQLDANSKKVVRVFKKSEHALPTDLLTSLLIDKSQNLWIGTDGNGVFKLDLKPPKFKLFRSGLDNMTKAIYSTGDGKVWVGSYSADGGLKLFDLKTGELLKNWKHQPGKPTSLPDNRIATITPGKNGFLWISTEKGLCRFDPVAGTVRRFTSYRITPGTIDYHVWIGEDTKGIGWILTPSGLAKLDQTSGTFHYIDSFSTDPNKRLDVWQLNGQFLSDTSLVCISPEGLVFFNTQTELKRIIRTLPGLTISLKNLRLKTILKESENRFWIGTENGLICWNLQTNKAWLLTEKNGLPNHFIYRMEIENKSRLWVSSNKGLFSFQIKLADSFDADPVFLDVEQYSTRQGIQSNEFNSGASFKDRNGFLYFAGIGGLNYFHPDSLNQNQFRPTVVLTDIRINNLPFAMDSSVTAKKNLILSHDQNTISVDFAALDFSHPDLNRFQTKLEGFDSDFGPVTTNRSIRYTNLDPGNYRLLIRGSNPDGIWSDSDRILMIVIQPPFWKTTWFLVAAFFVVVAIVIQTSRMITSRKVKKAVADYERKLEVEKEKERERARISRDMHDDVGAGLTKIALTLQGYQHKKHLSGEDDPDIQKAASTASGLIDNLSNIVWALNPYHDPAENLAGYFRTYASDWFQNTNIECRFVFQDPLPDIKLHAEIRRTLFLVYKESLHNILKYSGCSVVEIKLSISEGKIFFSVSDNGIGIQPEIKSKKGNGLINMKRRIEEINGTFVIQSVPGNGTQIQIEIPV